jgi:hypothetical protein
VLGSHGELLRVGILLQGSDPSLLALLLGLIALFHRSACKGCSQKFIKKSTIGGMRYFEKGIYGAFCVKSHKGGRERRDEA